MVRREGKVFFISPTRYREPVTKIRSSAWATAKARRRAATGDVIVSTSRVAPPVKGRSSVGGRERSLSGQVRIIMDATETILSAISR